MSLSRPRGPLLPVGSAIQCLGSSYWISFQKWDAMLFPSTYLVCVGRTWSEAKVKLDRIGLCFIFMPKYCQVLQLCFLGEANEKLLSMLMVWLMKVFFASQFCGIDCDVRVILVLWSRQGMCTSEWDIGMLTSDLIQVLVFLQWKLAQEGCGHVETGNKKRDV